MKKERSKPFILWFDEIGIEAMALVGGKNASLGEMLRHSLELQEAIAQAY